MTPLITVSTSSVSRKCSDNIRLIGTVFNLVAANFTGVAISYAIGQSAPMVAALWGILVWKEFQGAGRHAKTLLALMFLFYILAILLIAKANTSG